MCKHKFTRNKLKSIDNRWIFFYIKHRNNNDKTREVTNEQNFRITYRKSQGNQD